MKAHEEISGGRRYMSSLLLGNSTRYATQQQRIWGRFGMQTFIVGAMGFLVYKLKSVENNGHIPFEFHGEVLEEEDVDEITYIVGDSNSKVKFADYEITDDPLPIYTFPMHRVCITSSIYRKCFVYYASIARAINSGLFFTCRIRSSNPC